MRFKINFLAFSNDEAEMKKKIMGYDMDQPIPDIEDEVGPNKVDREKKTCLQNIIIVPVENSTKSMWDTFCFMLLFVGYYRCMYHIAFNIDKSNSEVDNKGIDQIIDIILLTDIALNFVTAYQKDVEWVTSLWLIIKNYLKHNFLFDIAATLPGILTYQQQQYYWFKLIRFVHIRDVFGHIQISATISNIFKSLFQKMGLNKSIMDKFSYSVNLIIIMFTSIHVLACCWIYIGRKFSCTWIKAGCDTDANKSFVDEYGEIEDNYTVLVTSIYWVITTLTTVGYGDFKGFSNEEYIFQMIVEFLGIGLFSFLMGSINSLVVSE